MIQDILDGGYQKPGQSTGLWDFPELGARFAGLRIYHKVWSGWASRALSRQLDVMMANVHELK